MEHRLPTRTSRTPEYFLCKVNLTIDFEYQVNKDIAFCSIVFIYSLTHRVLCTQILKVIILHGDDDDGDNDDDEINRSIKSAFELVVMSSATFHVKLCLEYCLKDHSGNDDDYSLWTINV